MDETADETGGVGLLGEGTLRSAGLGLLAGAIEAVVVAATTPALLGVADRLALGAAAAVAEAGLAAVLGLAVGLVTVLPRSWTERPVRLARQLAGVAFLLAGVYLWEAAALLLAEDRAVGALVLGALPLLVAVIVFFNARLWLRRAARGEPAVPWLAVAGVVAVAGIGASAGIGALRAPQVTAADGPSVVLVTVDGLRRDAVGFLGGPPTPALDALAAEGIVFADAVTPAPAPRPAQAAALAGVHPLRLALLDADDRLARGWRTAPEALADAGLLTAAFLSSDAAGPSSGLQQGFRAVDDAPPAWRRAHLVRRLLGPGEGRDALATVAAFERWLPAHADRPFAAWIQLADPHRAAVAGVPVAEGPIDEAVGRVREALARAGALERTTIVVAGTHGELLGAHGGHANRTLYDEVVRVPLVIRTPDRPLVPRVEAQVRLMDLANTLLDAARVELLDESEGVSLLAYGSGLRKATMWTSLVGVDLDGSVLLGLRNNGVKYVSHADGREELYDVRADPGEQRDIAAEQPATLEQARQLLSSERKALERARGR